MVIALDSFLCEVNPGPACPLYALPLQTVFIYSAWEGLKRLFVIMLMCFGGFWGMWYYLS